MRLRHETSPRFTPCWLLHERHQHCAVEIQFVMPDLRLMPTQIAFLDEPLATVDPIAFKPHLLQHLTTFLATPVDDPTDRVEDVLVMLKLMLDHGRLTIVEVSAEAAFPLVHESV